MDGEERKRERERKISFREFVLLVSDMKEREKEMY
jgi:hypothetical protein